MKALVKLNFVPQIFSITDAAYFNDSQYGPLLTEEQMEKYGSTNRFGYVGIMGKDLTWTTCNNNAARVFLKDANVYLEVSGARHGIPLGQVLSNEEIELAKQCEVVSYETTDKRLTWFQTASDVAMPFQMAAKSAAQGKQLSENWYAIIKASSSKSAAWISASFGYEAMVVATAYQRAMESKY